MIIITNHAQVSTGRPDVFTQVFTSCSSWIDVNRSTLLANTHVSIHVLASICRPVWITRWYTRCNCLCNRLSQCCGALQVFSPCSNCCNDDCSLYNV